MVFKIQYEICLTNREELVLAPPFLIILLLHQQSRIKALPDLQSFLTAFNLAFNKMSIVKNHNSKIIGLIS